MYLCKRHCRNCWYHGYACTRISATWHHYVSIYNKFHFALASSFPDPCHYNIHICFHISYFFLIIKKKNYIMHVPYFNIFFFFFTDPVSLPSQPPDSTPLYPLFPLSTPLPLSSCLSSRSPPISVAVLLFSIDPPL